MTSGRVLIALLFVIWFGLTCSKNPTAIEQENFWSELTSLPGELEADEFAFGHGGHIFAATWGNGMLISADDGQTWTPQNEGFRHLFLETVLIKSPSGIFVGLGAPGDDTEGVFISQDNGLSWSNSGLERYGIISMISTPSGQIFVGCSHSFWGSGALFRSDNNGETWQELDKQVSTSAIYSLAYSKNNVLFAGTEGAGLLKSETDGDSWTTVISNHSFWSIVVNSKQDVFACRSNGMLYRSNDQGINWTIIPTEIPTGRLVVDSQDHLYMVSLGSANGLRRSIDNGNSWHRFDSGLPNLVTSTLAIDSNDRLYVSFRGGGVFRRSMEITN